MILIDCQVRLFSHLQQYEKEKSVTRDLPVVGGNLHPAVMELGIQVRYVHYKEDSC
jgi:hypothetical protein